MNKKLMVVNSISKTIYEKSNSISILKNVSLELEYGKSIAITGNSGSGKTTLLHILAGLDEQSSGDVYIDNINWQSIKIREKNKIRNKKIGFIYQHNYLIKELSAVENIAIPQIIGGVNRKTAIKNAKELMVEFGMGQKVNENINTLSGGEKQRVNIARALSNNPQLIIADEPTGSLDEDNAEKVLQYLQHVKNNHNTSLILVTHDVNLAKNMDEQYILNHGVLTKCT